MKILFENFWLRIKKITEMEKGAKIAPFVLPSTAMFTCFNRPKNKNARPNNSLSKPAFSRTLDIERCLHSFFFSFLFFSSVSSGTISQKQNHLNVKRCKRQNSLLADQRRSRRNWSNNY